MCMPTTPEQLAANRPAKRLPAVRTSRQKATRRAFATGALLTVALPLVVPSRAFAAQYQPKNREDAAAANSYEGPIYGHVVEWDDRVWGMSSSGSEEMGYEYDYVTLTGIPTDGLSSIVHDIVDFADLDEAEDGALEMYLSQYGTPLTEVEVYGEWASPDAVGVMFAYTEYEDVPFTYIEYSMTDDDEVWRVSYIQIRESSWEEDAVLELFHGVTVDGDPHILAGDVEEIVDSVTSEL